MPDDRMWNSLEQLHDKIDNNSKTLIINTSDLRHHIKRTDLLEQHINHIEKDVTSLSTNQNSVIKVFKIIAYIITIIGIIIGILHKFNVI